MNLQFNRSLNTNKELGDNNIVGNIRKYEALKEYLNQRGVSQKILRNPRIYEIMDMLIDDFNIIFLNEETIQKLDNCIIVNNSNLSININDSKIEICPINQSSRKLDYFEKRGERTRQLPRLYVGGIKSIITSQINQEDKSIEKTIKTRIFNSDGIEMERRKQTKTIQENAENMDDAFGELGDIEILKRDHERLNAIKKVMVKDGEVMPFSEYYVRKNPLELHNIVPSEEIISRVMKTERILMEMEDNSKEVLNNVEFYNEKFYARRLNENDFIKSLYDGSYGSYEDYIKKYKEYNFKYGLPKIYEKGIDKMYLSGEMSKGEE